MFRRFFLVMGGVVLSSLLFLALPVAAVGARPGPATLLPALVIAWALSMAVFRAPALSLLGRHARPGALPLAASVLTGAGALVGAAAPPARAWLLSLGAGPTFAAASAALLVSALVVRALERREPAPHRLPGGTGPARSDGRSVPAGSSLGVGTSSALGFRFLVGALPRAGSGPGGIGGRDHHGLLPRNGDRGRPRGARRPGPRGRWSGHAGRPGAARRRLGARPPD